MSGALQQYGARTLVGDAAQCAKGSHKHVLNRTPTHDQRAYPTFRTAIAWLKLAFVKIGTAFARPITRESGSVFSLTTLVAPDKEERAMRIRDKDRAVEHRLSSNGWLLLLTLLLASFAAGCGRSKPTAPSGGANPSVADQSSGTAKVSAPEPQNAASQTVASLYGRHCAACHGDKGDGKGIAAKFLYPKPRDFRAGNFRLVSTANNVPTLEDLEAVIVRGMPGSSMPPWAHLSTGERRELAEYVIELRRQGAKDVELAIAAEEETERTPEELEAAIAPLTTPGPLIEVPPLPPSSAAAIDRGRELFKSKGCAACHGNEGRGDGQQQMIDSEGLATRPRDLTRGLYKGSPEPVAVYRRILAGMPGTPMPSLQNVEPAMIADLTHFVLSLSNEAVRNAVVLTRQRIVARQVAELPDAANSSAWQQAPAVEVRTVPLWWRDDAEPVLQVQALHDGKSICLRLSWADARADEDALRSEDFEDAVAVEIFAGANEPFFGMGGTGAPIDMWFWDADRQSKSDIESVNPEVVVDIYPLNEEVVATAEYDRPGTHTAAQPPLTLPAVAAHNEIVPGNDISAASSLEAAGPGSVTFRPVKSQLVQAHGNWAEGRWTVTMTRALQVPASSGVALQPGMKVSAAFAIFDGTAKDRDGKKMVSIWQDVELEQK